MVKRNIGKYPPSKYTVGEKVFLKAKKPTGINTCTNFLKTEFFPIDGMNIYITCVRTATGGITSFKPQQLIGIMLQ